MMIKRNPNYRGRALRIIISCAIIFLLAHQAVAQRPYERHSLIRGDMPPGLAAETYRLTNPEALTFHVQPVRIIAPDGARVEVGIEGAFVETDSSRVILGMSVGPVYRLKVTRIPRHFGRELYPSIEILDKLNPPEGLESKFPIQVVISQDDLEQALEGRMVTKVIYLENPETALPQRHSEGSQPFFDVGGGEDPLRAAERLGRPMAILRVGSRLPTYTEDDQGFGFHGPAPIMIAQPQPVDTPHNWDAIEEFEPLKIPNVYGAPMVPGEVLKDGDSIPPIQLPDENAPAIVPGEVLQDRDSPQQVPVPNPPPIAPSEIQQMRSGSGGR